MINENRFGSAIYKETPGWVDVKPPASQQYFDSMTYFSRGVTEKLNALCGGNKSLSSDIKALDINPALIDHLIQAYIPGFPSQLFKTADVGPYRTHGLHPVPTT